MSTRRRTKSDTGDSQTPENLNALMKDLYIQRLSLIDCSIERLEKEVSQTKTVVWVIFIIFVILNVAHAWHIWAKYSKRYPSSDNRL